MQKIKVKNCNIIKIQSFDDFPDGQIYIGESGKDVPIDIKRFYFINNLFNKNAVRGKHAHRKLEQYIFCINGQFVLNLDDGKTKQSITMNDPTIGIKLGPMLWHTMSKFSKDCLILVLANDFYDESDYIRKYDEFLSCLKKVKK
ncbi:MAG: FdtA/QdtA family cupin domain-containing protein [Candidatus Paceibacterota bacterium]|jgi:dTDP-4-dehydrorhamnose 3,5-epimerase-like enzyme